MNQPTILRLLSQSSYQRRAIMDQLRPVICAPMMVNRLRSGRGSVLLKPNFVVPAPRDDASTTHPEFYLAVAELLLEQGLKVGIGESPAIGSCHKALKAHGVLEECRDLGIEVVEFSSSRSYAGVEDEPHYASLTVAQELSEWQHLINLPKLKTHQQFTFTAACKNLYGCVSGKRKFVRHNLCGNDPVRFAKMIIANAMQVNSVLHIADGIDALHVKGPRGGETYALNRIIVAEDPLALDWLFCQMTNLEPLQTPLFKALDAERIDHVRTQCASIMQSVADDNSQRHPDAGTFSVVDDFIHAPLIHISFSPWAIARSGWRTMMVSMRGSLQS